MRTETRTYFSAAMKKREDTDPVFWNSEIRVSDGAGNGTPLPLCLHVYRHSPDGFAWGYSGSGPAQLALAILCDFLEHSNNVVALQLHQEFKSRFVAAVGMDSEFRLTGEQILEWLNSRLSPDVIAELRKKYPAP
jgi:hypothetical protein